MFFLAVAPFTSYSKQPMQLFECFVTASDEMREVSQKVSLGVPAGNGTTRVMKMLPGYPFKALNNYIFYMLIKLLK